MMDSTGNLLLMMGQMHFGVFFTVFRGNAQVEN